MQVYTELTEPTAVNSAVSLNFLSSAERNLVVAKSSLLQIFRLIEHEETDDDQIENDVKDAERASDRRVYEGRDQEDSFALDTDMRLRRETVEKTTKLVLVAQYSLSGSVTSMVRVKVPYCKSGADCLLVSFESAKLSLLEWDPATYQIATISLHYYEGGDLKSPLMTETPYNYLISDPKNRCAAFKFNYDMVAILPFRQKEDEDLVIPDNDSFEYDLDDDGDKEKADAQEKAKTEEAEVSDAPYYPSFVLTAAQLDEAVEQIVDIVFLHEYREPTFGIVYQPRQTSVGMLEMRKDTVHFVVVTLDLDQKASTSIMSVRQLPFDIFKAVALPLPIGGTLLFGNNEIVHVDQAGKTTAIAVNQLAQQYSAFSMTDQSTLELNLEGCQALPLPGENGDVLIVPFSGDFLLLSFKTEGRSISGISARKITDRYGTAYWAASSSTMIDLGGRRFFLGSEDFDSVIWGYKRKGEKLIVSEKSEVKFERDADDVIEGEEEDDLYGDSSTSPITPRKVSSAYPQGGKHTGDYVFRQHDRLTNIAPCRDITFGRPLLSQEKQRLHKGVAAELELLTITGKGSRGAVTVLNTGITPQVAARFDFQNCKRLWSVHSKEVIKGQSVIPSSVSRGYEEQIRASDEYHTYLFASKEAETLVYKVATEFEPLKGTDLESFPCATLDIGTFQEGLRIAQVCETDVKIYDSDLQLIQIVSTFDEETSSEPNIASASFADPYMLLIRVDGSISVDVCNKKTLELEALTKPDSFKETKYINGCLYTTVGHDFGPDTSLQDLCLLLTDDGILQIFNLPTFEVMVSIPHFDMMLPFTSPNEPTARFHTARDAVTEMLVADLGDPIKKSPYLIMRTKDDDLIIYEPFFHESIRFRRVYNTILPNVSLTDGKTNSGTLVKVDNISGYGVAFMSGDSPTFVIKTSKSPPRLYRLQGDTIKSLSAFHTKETERGFLYIDVKGAARVCHLPIASFENTWLSRRVQLGNTPLAAAYFDSQQIYAVTTLSTTKEEAVEEEEEDDYKIEDADPNESNLPEVEAGQIVMINPLTWTITDRYQLPAHEIPLTIKTVEMEASEITKVRKMFVAVGTGIMKGENAAARGAIYVFEVINVVPEIGKPETNKKFKLVVREEVKGIVSTISGIDGFLLVAQGQKAMIRGLKEDNTLLPVAFLDMSMYVSVAKTLNKMILFGDVIKGISLVGFTEEPYKMVTFGKDTRQISAVAGDFLPVGDACYFIVGDSRGNIHVLQYDPENPRSVHGTRLVPKGEIYTGHEIQSITLLPKKKSVFTDSEDEKMEEAEDEDEEEEEFLCLVSTMTGVFGMVSSIPESMYRRLNVIQGQVTNSGEHVGGLNPRAYRAAKFRNTSMEPMRAILDGKLLMRWLMLGTGRRQELASRAGTSEEMLREDLWFLQDATTFF